MTEMVFIAERNSPHAGAVCPTPEDAARFLELCAHSFGAGEGVIWEVPMLAPEFPSAVMRLMALSVPCRLVSIETGRTPLSCAATGLPPDACWYYVFAVDHVLDTLYGKDMVRITEDAFLEKVRKGAA